MWSFYDSIISRHTNKIPEFSKKKYEDIFCSDIKCFYKYKGSDQTLNYFKTPIFKVKTNPIYGFPN